MSTSGIRTRLVLADDHPVMRGGLQALIQDDGNYDIAATCGDGRSALEAIRTLKPDLALLDMQMPDMNGLEVLSCLSKDEDGPAVVFLTASATDQQLVAAVAGGARGIILKDAAADTLLDCLHTVARGGRWVPQLLISAASEREAARHAGVARIDIVLTPRERELVLLVAEGLSNKEIARRLNLTEGTVKIHLHNAYQKLDVTNRTSMAALVLSYRNQSNR